MSKKMNSVRNTAADPTLAKVLVTIQGREYFLAWDFAAIARAEALTGANLLAGMSFQALNASQLRGLLFAALLKLQPETTLAQVDAMLADIRTVWSVVPALAEAYTGAQPESFEVKDPNGEALEPPKA